MSDAVSVAKNAVGAPPPWALWITIIIAILTFLWNVANSIYRQRQERFREDRGREDAYWFQQVILPQCIEALDRFVGVLSPDAVYLQELITTGAFPFAIKENFDSVLTSAFYNARNLLLRELMILELVSDDSENSCYAACGKILENVEDEVTSYVVRFFPPDEGHAAVSANDDESLTIDQHYHRARLRILKELRDAHLSKFCTGSGRAQKLLHFLFG